VIYFLGPQKDLLSSSSCTYLLENGYLSKADQKTLRKLCAATVANTSEYFSVFQQFFNALGWYIISVLKWYIFCDPVVLTKTLFDPADFKFLFDFDPWSPNVSWSCVFLSYSHNFDPDFVCCNWCAARFREIFLEKLDFEKYLSLL